MYKLVSMRDSVRVDPSLLGKKPMEAVDVSLRKAYEGLMDRQVGVVLCITKVESVGEGKITDDYISYSKDGVLMGRESKRVLKSGDKVRARIITVSYKHSQSAKVGLTMRQPGLGKIDWAGEEEGGVVLA
jgi:DNA-directed RNA polymerase subunit E'/Rpb7